MVGWNLVECNTKWEIFDLISTVLKLYAVSDEELSVDVHYGYLRRHLGFTSFNRMMNHLEYGNVRCKPFFNNSI